MATSSIASGMKALPCCWVCHSSKSHRSARIWLSADSRWAANCSTTLAIFGTPLRITSSAELSIRQLVIVALSGILREVLNELPIVALSIVEVPALSVRMLVGRRGIPVPSRLHSFAQRFHVVYLIGEMIHTRQAPIRRPGFLGLCVRLIQGKIGFIGAYVYPSAAVTYAFAPHSKLRKRGLQESNHPFDVLYKKVRMFKPDNH